MQQCCIKDLYLLKQNAKIMKHSLTFLTILMFFLVACEQEDPIIPNEEELITTVKYQLTPVGGGTMVEFSYQDIDGDGGNPPVIVNGTLAAGTSYTGNIILLNEQETPAEDIGAEVLEEAEEHQFFYTPSASNLTVAYADQDANGNPVGLQTTLTTTTAGTLELNIILKHEPNKTASGVSAGDPANSGGETDIEITFDVVIP